MATLLTRRLGGPSGSGSPGVSLHEIRGGPGPTLAVLGGVHGDEGQGIRGALQLLDAVIGLRLRGRLAVVPVAHEAAAAAVTRTSPLDGRDLARSFPGDPDGSPTQRLAHLLEQAVLRGADAVLDLHSSGVHYAMARLVGYCDDGSAASRMAAEAAAAMAMPVTWRHPGPPPPGRSGSGAHARGRPFLYVESSEGDDVGDLYRDACLRLLAHLGMIPAHAAPSPPARRPLRLAGPGDLDGAAVRAPHGGILEVRARLLDRVAEGEAVGWLRDLEGGPPRPLGAPRAGTLVMLRRTRLVAAGDLVAFVTGDEAEAAMEPDGRDATQ
jgi:predicted deacylase